MTKVQLFSLAALLAAGSVYGQISLTNGLARIITFDSADLPLLQLAGTPSGSPRISESNAWNHTGSNPTFSLASTSVNYVGPSVSIANPYTNDYNGNTNTDDSQVIFQNYIATSSSVTGLSGYGIGFDANQWADKSWTFKFVNNTGSTVNNVRFFADLYSQDQTHTPATVYVEYATDPSGPFTAVDSLVGTNGGSNVWTAKSVNSLQSITLANGEDVYLRINYDQNGQGNGFAFDNVGVQIPEPSTYAALAGALALGLVAYRRRR